MGCDIGSVKKKNPKLLVMACGSRYVVGQLLSMEAMKYERVKSEFWLLVHQI